MSQRFWWRHVSPRTYYFEDREGPGAVGFVEQLFPSDFNACDMSTTKWVWCRFENLDDAKAWVEVCIRMQYANHV